MACQAREGNSRAGALGTLPLHDGHVMTLMRAACAAAGVERAAEGAAHGAPGGRG